MVLLRGLSPNAATIQKLQTKEHIGSRKTTTVVGAKNADRAFDALFRPSRKRGSADEPA